MASKRKQSSSGRKTNKKSEIDNVINILKNSYGISFRSITEKLYDVNCINILKKIKDNKMLLVSFFDNFDENIWTTNIMEYVIINIINDDMMLFIYFFDKFIINFVFRHKADYIVKFDTTLLEFYSSKYNNESCYQKCLKYFEKGVKKMNLNDIKKLFEIADKYFIDSIFSIKENEERCEIISDLQQIYFNKIAYHINEKLWESPYIIYLAIEYQFYILQYFCVNKTSHKIIKGCLYEDKLMFFQQLKEYFHTIFPNQLEYFEYFKDHEDPIDKDIVNEVIEYLSNPILRKTEKGRQLENKYELLPL